MEPFLLEIMQTARRGAKPQLKINKDQDSRPQETKQASSQKQWQVVLYKTIWTGLRFRDKQPELLRVLIKHITINANKM
jgi:hypothetical protein